MRRRRLTILLFLFIIVLGFLFIRIRNRFDLSDLKLKPKLQSLNSLKQKLNLKPLSTLIPKLNSGLTSTSTQASTSGSASQPTPESPISTGKPLNFNVGYKIYDFSYQDSNGKSKILTTAVWYPTEQASQDYTYHTLKESLQQGDIKSRLAANAPVANSGPYPLFIFSHGATTCGTQSLFLTEYLASRGFIVVAPDYPDEVIICRIKGGASGKSLQILRLLSKLKEGNSTSEEVLSYFDDWFRFKGLSLVIDKMVAENRNPNSVFYQQIDENKIVAGGHSAGAITTWGLIGANKNYQIDKRIKAALLLSGGPFPYYAEDFARVNIPVMMMHGTADEGLNPQYPREIEYQNSNAPKFELVIKKADHGAFANGQCAGYNSVAECQAGDSLVQVINKYSLAFLDWYFRQDPQAKEQLNKSDNILSIYQKEF